MQEKKLGRGLDYLINISSNAPTTENAIENIKLIHIRKNRFQPREAINEESLQELISSIKENGVIQPILVRKEGLYYELIAGERRLKACIALGSDTIPAIILDVPENKLLQIALIENIQREDLNPIEEAKAYQALLKLENLTHENLSIKIGKKRSTISNTLRLLELPKEIQDCVSRGTLSQGHARTLLGFNSKDSMLDAFRKIQSKKISVRDLERLAKNKDRKKTKLSSSSNKTKDSNIHNLEEHLKNKFGTKVDISQSGEEGTISFHFYSKDDFSRLISVFLH